jgi:hypothetical protein
VILEDTKTTFDAQAISISFLVTEENEEPSSLQIEHFCHFLNHSMINNKTAENYKVFHRSSLLAAATNEHLTDNMADCIKKWETSN